MDKASQQEITIEISLHGAQAGVCTWNPVRYEWVDSGEKPPVGSLRMWFDDGDCITISQGAHAIVISESDKPSDD